MHRIYHWRRPDRRRGLARFSLLIALCLSLVTDNAVAAGLTAAGPGNRIAGVDISQWQHPGQSPIDFAAMYSSGVRFVIIKGGDSQDAADATALKYLKIDRPAAQAAGLYTGMYYYAYLPDTNDPKAIVTDAKAQAQKAIWRLSSIGGYTPRDLPMALDIENNCVRASRGVCTKYTSRNNVTLWTQTWLDTVAAKTVRKPIVYSYAQFLEAAINRATTLTKYPLWVAAYAKVLPTATTQPATKTVGCYATAWTKADCSSQWQIWQYSSCGIGSKYGVPSERVDLNLFAGTASQFYRLVRGVWTPSLTDLLPVNETSTLRVESQTSATTNDPVTFVVSVSRPDGTPVVTGSVDFTSISSLSPNGTQSVVRSATGRWSLTITNLPAGNYLGLMEYLDPTGTHSPSSMPVQFVVTQGPTPTPTPTPSPTKTPTKPVDVCAGQVRN
jgi:GH25 family lysozyme M1 (1,4-beta-N-acetylmuramidase)